jgi:hypothetical protein
MIKTESSEKQIEKILAWIEEDIENRYPLIGTKLLEAAAKLEVNNHLMFIANRRISFGIHKLQKPKKEVQKEVKKVTEETPKKDVVITSVTDKPTTKKV